MSENARVAPKFGSIFTSRQKRAAQHYRDVFLGKATQTHGLEVFDDLLTRLHLYDTITSSEIEKLALRNFALEMLARMGILNDRNRMALLKMWLNLPMPVELKDVAKDLDDGR